MFKVLVSDKMAAEGIRILEGAAPQVEVTVQTAWKPGELRDAIGPYHALLIRSATKVTAEIIAAAGSLRVIGRAGIGVDNVDLAAASRKGIVVMNTPTGNTVTTAEHALAMMMSLARKIPQATASMKSGAWEKSAFEGVELYEKTLGLLGLGNIGSLVARRALGLGMRVVAYDPLISTERAAQLGVQLLDLDELLARADFISLHVPKNDQTKNLFRAENFAKMKRGVRIVNCARGGIVNEADLVEAIRGGRVAGAALDVFEKEPLDPASPLLGLAEVILTPHLGASTREAQVNVATEVARQTVDFLTRGVVRNAVNVPSVDLETMAKIGPYLDLAGRMGRFLGHLADGRMEEVRVSYAGEVAGVDTRPLTAAFLEGLLRPILEEGVNIVNAPYVARERGMRVGEATTSETGDYTSLVTATLRTDREEHTVSGTLFARRDPRIVRIDGYELELAPAGHLLLFANDDRPGVIGKIGTLLGEHDVNIAGMQLGRKAVRTTALAVLTVDGAVPDPVLAAIRALPFIKRAVQMEI
jgi:D-3-phosphoglycerate dehydrogenase